MERLDPINVPLFVIFIRAVKTRFREFSCCQKIKAASVTGG